jgi:hypothetical protein
LAAVAGSLGWAEPLSQLTAFPYPFDLFTIMGPIATVDEAREVLLGRAPSLA